MNTVAFIVQDVHFPYRLFEQALEYAKDCEASFRAIIMTNEIIRFDHREFFSDAIDDFFGVTSLITPSQRIIAQHLRFLQQRAGACHLPFSSVILTSPSLHQLIDHTREADHVFMELQDESVFELWNFSRHELVRRLPRLTESVY